MKSFNRYVILSHDHPTQHFDFMLEKEGVLQTWRLNLLLENAPFLAEKIHDHRMESKGPFKKDPWSSSKTLKNKLPKE